jgi:hypothetical protein
MVQSIGRRLKPIDRGYAIARNADPLLPHCSGIWGYCDGGDAIGAVQGGAVPQAPAVHSAAPASANMRRSHWCARSLSMRGCQTWIAEPRQLDRGRNQPDARDLGEPPGQAPTGALIYPYENAKR